MGIVNSNEWLVVSLPRRKQLTKFPNGGTQNCWSSLFPSRFSFFFVFFLCRRFAFPSRRKERLNGSSIIQRTNQSTFFFFFFFYNRRDDLTVAVCHFLSPFSFFFFFRLPSPTTTSSTPFGMSLTSGSIPVYTPLNVLCPPPLTTPLSFVAGWVFSHPERIEKKRKMQ